MQRIPVLRKLQHKPTSRAQPTRGEQVRAYLERGSRDLLDVLYFEGAAAHGVGLVLVLSMDVNASAERSRGDRSWPVSGRGFGPASHIRSQAVIQGSALSRMRRPCGIPPDFAKVHTACISYELNSSASSLVGYFRIKTAACQGLRLIQTGEWHKRGSPTGASAELQRMQRMCRGDSLREEEQEAAFVQLTFSFPALSARTSIR